MDIFSGTPCRIRIKLKLPNEKNPLTKAQFKTEVPDPVLISDKASISRHLITVSPGYVVFTPVFILSTIFTKWIDSWSWTTWTWTWWWSIIEPTVKCRMLHGEQLLKVAGQKKIDETPTVVLCSHGHNKYYIYTIMKTWKRFWLAM